MGASIRGSMICAGFPQGGKDSCNGDSGGPMMVLREGKYTQVGIVSFGIGCAQPNQYGVYARIEFALPWINELVSDVQLTDAATAQRKINTPTESEFTPNSSQRGDEGEKIAPRQGGGGSLSFLGVFSLLMVKRTNAKL
jgi:secreted trypsin-like serine protease